MSRVVTTSLFALLSACGAPAPTLGGAPATATMVAAEPAAAAPPAAAPRQEAPGLEGPIGVAVCDAYVATYRRCVEDVIPEEDRAAHREVLAAQRLAWARAKSDPSLASGLADACAAAKVAARASLPRCLGW